MNLASLTKVLTGPLCIFRTYGDTFKSNPCVLIGYLQNEESEIVRGRLLCHQLNRLLSSNVTFSILLKAFHFLSDGQILATK